MVLFDEKDRPLEYGYYLVSPQSREPSAAQLRFMEWLRAQGPRRPGRRRVWRRKRPVFAAQDI
ncbi:MAG: hypothetical protein WDN06_16540 [Asticcacaulis sp.]